MYHALDDLKQPHLKWLDLRLLFSRLIRAKSQIITQILFFQLIQHGSQNLTLDIVNTLKLYLLTE